MIRQEMHIGCWYVNVVLSYYFKNEEKIWDKNIKTYLWKLGDED
jgi:hypothetical protein